MEISITVKFVYCMFKYGRKSYNFLKINKEIFKFLATIPLFLYFGIREGIDKYHNLKIFTVDFHRIAVIKAGLAQRKPVHGCVQILHTHVAQRISADHPADFFYGVGGG